MQVTKTTKWTNSRGNKIVVEPSVNFTLDNSGNRRTNSCLRQIEHTITVDGKSVSGWIKKLDKPVISGGKTVVASIGLCAVTDDVMALIDALSVSNLNKGD